MYCVNHSAMKVEQSPEESQDMTALEKELDHFVKQLKQKVTLGYTQADNGAHPGHSF